VTRLIDLGERRILREILEQRYAGTPGMGDDCALLTLREAVNLVVTTDPCPPPVAGRLGYTSLYYHGWLLATINLSDLAATGARPVGMLTSLILPPETEIEEFTALLDGLDEALATADCHIIGGNIKEDKAINLSGTALGVADRPILRSGARSGDDIFIIGEPGRFWAAVLAFDASGVGSVPRELIEAVIKPRAKVSEGLVCGRVGVTSMIDSSDGLYPSLTEIATKSGVGLDLTLDDLPLGDSVRSTAERLGIDPVRLVLGWGDWVLVGTVEHESFDHLVREIRAVGGSVLRIGRVTAKNKGVILAHYGGKSGSIMNLDSERFAADSWFTSGLEGYIRKLTGDPVISSF
jgi:thiamine-monophosphate kinase